MKRMPALLAALMEWQPIETAPKDGTTVIVCRRAGKSRWRMWHPDEVWSDTWGRIRDDEYNWQFAMEDPTHWIPLPEPPHAKKKKAKDVT
jgi:hypothetical protein